MEFYGSRYTPKRYRKEPVVVSTEYYDYTSTASDTNDCDSSTSHYRVMPITYEEITPGYCGNGVEDCYNIQSYGSNVVLPFMACIEIYNNKTPNGKHLHFLSHSNPHPHHHVGATPVSTADRLGSLNSRGGGGNLEYNSTGDDEIIINVRQVPVYCACCGRQPAASGPGYGVTQPPTPPPIYRMPDRSSRYDTPVQYFKYRTLN